MKFQVSLTALAMVGQALSKEVEVDAVRHAELYASGKMHEKLMRTKKEVFASQEAAGVYKSEQYAKIDRFVPCVNGLATAVKGDPLNTFKCKNVDLHHFLSHAELGSATGRGSSSWGWTAPGGREFIAIGQADGAAFAEITKFGKLVYLGRLPKSTAAKPEIWREIRGYKHYMVIGSEAVNHNIQIFDMKKLLKVDPKNPVTFHPENDSTGIFSGLPIGRTHNVVTNEETGWAYAVGAQPRNSTCLSGLIFIDLKDPSKPVTPGCNGQDGYVHDAQCLIYRGPDRKYAGKEICYGYNEDSLTIYDVSNKKNSSVISRTSYEGASYTHQGWVLDPKWQTHLIMDDEYDEYDGVEPAADGHPVTYIWDITSLEKPRQTGYYKNKRAYGPDHNQYIKNGFSYQSNYGSGLSILDVRSIPRHPDGSKVSEVGFFDVYPEDDGFPNGGNMSFVGSWSSYASFSSGWVFVNTISRGGFVVRVRPEALR